MIYKNGDRFYKMIEPVGASLYKDYALWRPVQKFLWFWIRDKRNKEDFYLDMEGFVKI